MPGPFLPKPLAATHSDQPIDKRWSEAENKPKIRYAAREPDWGGKPVGCPCCIGWSRIPRVQIKKETKWMVQMYERGWMTLGMARGGKKRHPFRDGWWWSGRMGPKGPSWVDYEWNLEYKNVKFELGWEGAGGDLDRCTPPSSVDLVELIVYKRKGELTLFGVTLSDLALVPRALLTPPRPPSTLSPSLTAQTAFTNVDEPDWVPISRISRGITQSRGVADERDDEQWDLCSLSSSVAGDFCID
jgi:hypothetical protein